ncbi:hypothetical protein DERF_000258 [Dermatophagoides farinae]|uniref:Uncharacterized protein n=1 Tax=Dermatophagoides farinae TaxID=6954 RepID=A0A922I9T5_DERFA|nr:hypothetical protein DERF_000258 [Dermatophagoides farinae]
MFDDIHNTKRKRNDDREFYIYIIHLSTNVFVCAENIFVNITALKILMLKPIKTMQYTYTYKPKIAK